MAIVATLFIEEIGRKHALPKGVLKGYGTQGQKTPKV